MEFEQSLTCFSFLVWSDGVRSGEGWPSHPQSTTIEEWPHSFNGSHCLSAGHNYYIIFTFTRAQASAFRRQRRVKREALFDRNALALYFKMFTIHCGRIGDIYMRNAMKTIFLGLTDIVNIFQWWLIKTFWIKLFVCCFLNMVLHFNCYDYY